MVRMRDAPVVPRPRLPTHAADAWGGGLVLAKPEYLASVAAVDGTVVAATEHIYLLRPGATKFKMRDMPDGAGDALAVAVEPRRKGGVSRFAVAGIDSLHIFDGHGVASVRFPEDHGEVRQLLWAPDVFGDAPGQVLYLLLDDRAMQLVPGGGPFGTFVELEGDIADAYAITTDQNGGFAYACLDEESSELDVWFLADHKTRIWHRRSIETPNCFWSARLAIAGKSVAVSFDNEGIWLSRGLESHPFEELEELRDAVPEGEQGGLGAIAFEGAGDDAPLLAAIADSPTSLHVSRVDAHGRATRIAEAGVEGPGGEVPWGVREIAWDATRRTLWSAAGPAGLLCTTAPGAPHPLGASKVS
jgi:hypothetical protein